MLKKMAVLSAMLLLAPVVSADGEPDSYRKAEVSYVIYGGSLGDMSAPTGSDKKIAFSVEGRAARELFDAIGPDKPDVCLRGTGARVRHRHDENLKSTLSKEGEYHCSFGFDLRTGKSIPGSIC
jgi:hypothetical protein